MSTIRKIALGVALLLVFWTRCQLSPGPMSI